MFWKRFATLPVRGHWSFATVSADGIAGREVVCGDLVVLAEGDRVPADAVLLEQDDLHTDETLLTGESVAVRKAARRHDTPPAGRRPGGNDLPYVFSGSLAVQEVPSVKAIAEGVNS